MSSEPTDRFFYYGGADLNARFSRVYGSDRDAGFGRIRHSIEPGISYSYIPKIKETNLPQMDVVDTIAQQNLLSVGLINRLTAHYKDATGFRSFDVLVWRVSEAYDINKLRSEDQVISSQARSPEVRSELFLRTPKLITLSATEIYDTVQAFLYVVLGKHLASTTDTVRFNISHQYLKNPDTKYLIGGAGTKIRKWDLDGQVWRDMLLKQITQQEYKVHYGSQCWGLGVTFIKRPGETQYLLTLDLKGLGVLKF